MSHTKTNQLDTLCPACDIGPFTRNHYFTGKLLVERDFTDEQRYYVEKLRHHNQRLHGWGVVCGLKVKQHENQACQNRFVCVTAGTAIDCCGREIIVRDETCELDITQAPPIKALVEANDTASHRLQICIRYRECPTENVPVLYDECGCDDTQCAPNRILEAYQLDVILDPPAPAAEVGTPRFEWGNTVALAHSFRVALHDGTSRLYVMTTDSPGSIYQLSTDNHTIVASQSLPAKGMAMAVANDGTRLYVVTEAIAPATKRQLYVFDTADLSLVRQLPIDNSPNSDVYLAVAPAPDNRLFVLIAHPGILRMYSTGINTAAGSPSPTDVTGLGADVISLIIGTDGTRAYVADPATGAIKVIDVTNAALDSTVSVMPPHAVISALALVPGASDMVAVADSFNKQLHLVGFNPVKLIASSTALPHTPAGLTVSPDGYWIYILENDAGGGSYVQVVSSQSLQLAPSGQLVNPGDEFEVGDGSQQLTISTAGDRIYIPYIGDLASATDGGVAIVDVDETACGEILWRHLKECPHCDTPNCVVLATIENYHVNDRLLDQTVPPANPIADDAANIARIDNRKGRKLLPSTQVLAELIECLLAHPAVGGAGKQGPVGPQGPQGPGVNSATAESIDFGQPPQAVFDAATGNIDFKIPKGEKGDSGPPGGAGIEEVDLRMVTCAREGSARIVESGNKHMLRLQIPTICDRDLTHISGINWVHGGEVSQGPQFGQKGLLIAFDHPVKINDIHPNSVMVLTRQQTASNDCWCEVRGKLNAIEFQIVGDVTSDFRQVPPATSANGVQFIATAGTTFAAGTYRVVVKGDFIRDAALLKAVDADHLPPWFVNPPAPHHMGDYTSGDGVAGGTFESWFTFRTNL